MHDQLPHGRDSEPEDEDWAPPRNPATEPPSDPHELLEAARRADEVSDAAQPAATGGEPNEPA